MQQLAQTIHQFTLNNIEFFLAVIIIAQGIILFGQSQIHAYCQRVFYHILGFMQSSAMLNLQHSEALKELEKKVKGGEKK